MTNPYKQKARKTRQLPMAEYLRDRLRYEDGKR
jgi:hypothetical protein